MRPFRGRCARLGRIPSVAACWPLPMTRNWRVWPTSSSRTIRSASARRLELALALMGETGAGRVAAALRHELWCAHREAAWRMRRVDLQAAQVDLVIEGAEWVRETAGRPTILISPMTLSLADASWIVTHAIGALAPDREVVLYGEGVDAGDVGFAEVDRRMVERWWRRSSSPDPGCAHRRRRLPAPMRTSMLPRYGSSAASVQLFGRPHPISAAFVTIASRPGVMLLPCLTSRGSTGTPTCRFFEPIEVANEALLPATLKRAPGAGAQVAQLVASILEMLIREAPHQWRLLATLAFEAPQMESA